MSLPEVTSSAQSVQAGLSAGLLRSMHAPARRDRAHALPAVFFTLDRDGCCPGAWASSADRSPRQLGRWGGGAIPGLEGGALPAARTRRA